MGDRTSLELVVYHCPHEDVGAIVDILDDYGFDRFGLEEQTGSLELGHTYLCSEILVGSSAEVAAAMPDTATWKVWESPAYEYLGQVHMHHPEMGVFVADCAADGSGVFTSQQIDRLLENTNADRARVAMLIGRAWESTFDELAAENRGTVLSRDASPHSSALQAAELEKGTPNHPTTPPADPPAAPPTPEPEVPR